MERIHVAAGKQYDVFVGAGLLGEAGDRIRAAVPGANTAYLVADDRVNELYGNQVSSSLTKAGFMVVSSSFPHGEASKNMRVLAELLERMADAGLTRTDVVVALGGGVTGDLAGFAAAIYLRGVRYVQLPTTLLAAADSSVGGKTAVDLAGGKNLAGAFWQPELVLYDTDTLSTLEKDQVREGVAECVKYGYICDADLAREIAAGALDRDISETVARCIRIKAEIVSGDERDTGRRQLLNFGHTPGHAIEQATGFRVPHGMAVAMGMALMARAAYHKRICSGECARAICSTLRALGLPTHTKVAPDELARLAVTDKKRKGDSMTIVVPQEFGRCVLHTIPVAQLLSWFKAGWEDAL